MVSHRTMGYILIVAAAVIMACGLFAFIFNPTSFTFRGSENLLMIDTGYFSLFAITQGTLLLKIKDVPSSSVAEASTLTAMGVIGSALVPGVLARVSIAIFSSATYNPAAIIAPLSIAIISIIVIAVISFLIAKEQIKRIRPDKDDFVMTETPYDKSTVYIVSIVFSLFLYGVSIALYFESWAYYHVVTTNLHAVTLFTNAVLGLVADRVKVTHLSYWHKTFTSYTFGIGLASTVSMVQLLVFFVSDNRYPKWDRADFTILALSQATFNILGLIMSGITSVAADNVHNLSPKPSKMPIADKTNAGMFASALLASGIAVFDMAIMNYPTYGFPALIVLCMVFVAAKHGISIQTTGNELAKYPYYALNVFNSLGSVWAISMTVYEFLATANNLTKLVVTFRFFAYIFAGLTVASLLPVAYFCINAAIRSRKELNNNQTIECNLTAA